MRSLIAKIAALMVAFPLASSAWAAGACPATESMRGGANNYRPNAPVVENLGTGWTVTGTVREAGTCTPIKGVRVQVWSATERGGEREPSNRGSVITDANGVYTMEISEVRPQFGQPHIHIAHDDPGYETLFLRPVLGAGDDQGMTVDFVLSPTTGNAPQS
jgi:hypothetical protein